MKEYIKRKYMGKYECHMYKMIMPDIIQNPEKIKIIKKKQQHKNPERAYTVRAVRWFFSIIWDIVKVLIYSKSINSRKEIIMPKETTVEECKTSKLKQENFRIIKLTKLIKRRQQRRAKGIQKWC